MNGAALRAFVSLLVLALPSACGEDAPRGADYGAACEEHIECASGICAGWPFDTVNIDYVGPFCTHECASDEDCAPFPAAGTDRLAAHTCGTMPDGRRVCLQRCEDHSLRDFETGVAPMYCIEGRQVAVENTPCASCGPDAFCDESVMCVPRRELGGECSLGFECLSDRCYGPEGFDGPRRCLLPLGEPCADQPEHCEVCLMYGTLSFCSERCQGLPGLCDGPTVCAGYRGDDASFLCRKRCNPSEPICPGMTTCELIEYVGDGVAVGACF